MGMKIYQEEQDWIVKTLTEHGKFADKHATARAALKATLKDRSKSCSDISRKAKEKWKGNYEREMTRRTEANNALMENYHAATARAGTNAELKLKCEQDVHTFREVKYNTWGELQRRRQEELQKSRDAHTQALVFEVAARQKADQSRDAGNAEMVRRRQQIAKETLSLNDRANEAFIKMQCEPDEMKIRQMMLDLGFSMPKLPDEEEEEVAAAK